MATSDELRLERARIVENMRALVDHAESEGRDFDGTEKEQYEKGQADFAALGERITRMEAIERQEAEMAEPIPGFETAGSREMPGGNRGGEAYRKSDLPGDAPNRLQRMAFLDVMRHGLGRVDAHVRELVEDSNGQILVPYDTEQELIRDIPKLTVMRGLASVRTTTSDRIRKRGLSGVKAGWGKLETDSSPAITEDSLTANSAFLYVEDLYGLAKIGEDELDDSDVNLETFLREEFSRVIAEMEDTAFVKGTGHASEQPQGWAYSTAVTAVPSDWSAGYGFDSSSVTVPDWAILEDLRKLTKAVPAAGRRNGSFVMSTNLALFVASRRDKNGQVLWQPSHQAGQPDRLHGYPVHEQDDVDSLASTAKVIAGFGDWQRGYRIYDRRGMTIQRLVELYATEGKVGFKMRRRVGGGLWDARYLRLLKAKKAA